MLRVIVIIGGMLCASTFAAAFMSIHGAFTARARIEQKLVKLAGGAHVSRRRLLHGSACLPKRDRADRYPFDVAV